MKLAYTYSDVLIKPKYSNVLSRETDVTDLSVTIGNHKIDLPVISANMMDVTGPKMASTLALNGGIGLLHRGAASKDSPNYLSPAHNVELYTDSVQRSDAHNQLLAPDPNMDNIENIGVSIGIGEEDKERFGMLYEAGARIFCIDVAHGHHVHVKNMLHWINTQFIQWARSERNKVTVIAGNIATPEAYVDLVDWGADAAKVGIGPSPVCRTRYNTGVGVPQLYALEMVHEEAMHSSHPISIIADGGISHSGDIPKALKFADAVMLGSMFAGTSETPGGVYCDEHGEYYKVYGGSSSGEHKGQNRFVEGIVKKVKFKGKIKYILKEITEGIQSAYSYVGVTNHSEFQNKCEFVFISGGARGESRI